MLERIADWLEHWLAPASRTASYIGVSMIVVLMALTVFNVLLRAFTGVAFTPMKELSEFALSILVFLTMPLCAVKGAHTVIDIISARLSARSQARLAGGIILLSLIMCGLFTWRMFDRGLWAVGSGQESTILGVKLFPFVFVAAIGFLLLALVYLMDWLRALKETRR